MKDAAIPYVNLEFDCEVRDVWKDLECICNAVDGYRCEGICRNEIENCRRVENEVGLAADSQLAFTTVVLKRLVLHAVRASPLKGEAIVSPLSSA